MVASTNPKKPRFIVAVDFGTTFTSVAFAHSESPEEVKLVQTWPHGSTGGATADQVPTEIHYLNKFTRELAWGYEVASRRNGAAATEPLKWFKLLLHDQSPAPNFGNNASASIDRILSSLEHIHVSSTSGTRAAFSHFTPPTVTPAQKTAQKLSQLNISPVTVVADFLENVRKVTLASIEDSYHITDVKIEYVLTVPAIWNDSAKHLMIEAAKEAGFGSHRTNFNLVSEPEAAAAYTLKAIQPRHLNVGDTFVICDAGGGTVDLISYKITGLDPLTLDESVSGTGELCGSVYLNERFEQYIRRIVGDAVIDKMKPRSKEEMMRTWEEKVKFKFGNQTGMEGYEVNMQGVPDDPENNIEDCFHTIDAEEVQKIFDPVIDCIVKLVRQQVNEVLQKEENVAAVLLVGGFGSSAYLLKRLKETLYRGKTIKVLQPVYAQTAIVRGALQRGLDGSIVKVRRARRFYGCSASAYYKSGENLRDHRYWDSIIEEYMVDNHLSWYIKRNAVVGDTVSISFDFNRTIPTTHSDLVFHDDLLACDLDQAPDYKWKNPLSTYTVCTLVSDLSSIPRSRFELLVNSIGESYYKVKFQLKLTLVDEVLRFELLFKGEIQGIVTTQFK